jgi:hypothetical protein
MFGDRGKTHPPNPETRHKGLSSSPYLDEAIGFFRILHRGKQLLRLTINAINELLIAVGNLVALQDGFPEPAQETSFDGAKPQPVDQQGSGFPNDFILEDEVLWLDGMFGKVLFQLEERMEPFAITCEYGRSIAKYGEGSFFSFRFRHGLSFL